MDLTTCIKKTIEEVYDTYLTDYVGNANPEYHFKKRCVNKRKKIHIFSHIHNMYKISIWVSKYNRPTAYFHAQCNGAKGSKNIGWKCALLHLRII